VMEHRSGTITAVEWEKDVLVHNAIGEGTFSNALIIVTRASGYWLASVRNRT
jgi:hypothetical protein